MKKQILILAAAMLLCVQYAGAFRYKNASDGWQTAYNSFQQQTNFYWWNQVTMEEGMNLGTAVGNEVALYAGTDDGLGATASSTLSYRIITIGDKFWAKFEANPLERVYGTDTWAAHVRHKGVNGEGVVKEFTLMVRNDNVAYIDRAVRRNNNDDTEFDLRAEDLTNGSLYLQPYTILKENAGASGDLGAASTQKFQYFLNTVNNSTSDVTAPVLSSATGELTGGNVELSMSATDDSDDFFYYIKDEGNGIEIVAFTNTYSFATQSSTKYNLDIIAIDYDGNMSNVKKVSLSTGFEATDNLALKKPATATVEENAGVNKSKANDGKNDTFWASGYAGAHNDAANHYWQVDLGSEYVIDKIKILWNGGHATDYKILTSLNGIVWEEAAHLGTPNPLNVEINLANPANARYVRMQGITANGYGMQIYEFEVYGTGFYNPDAGTDLETVSITHSHSAFYVNDEYTFKAKALSGQSLPIADAEIVWSVTDENDGATTDATIDEDGTFTATAAGAYKIKVSAEADEIIVYNELAITLTAERQATIITFAQNKANAGTNNNSEIFFVGEAVPFNLEVRDQYNNIMTDATLDFTGANVTVDQGAKTATWSAVGNPATLSVSATKVTTVSQSFSVQVVPAALAIAKGGWNVTASSEYTNPENSEISYATYVKDDNTGSRWISANNTSPGVAQAEWLRIDLGAKYDLAAVDIAWEGACAKEYTIEVSETGDDAGSFTSLGGENRDNGIWNHTWRVLAGNATARYILINCAVPATEYRYSIYEVTAYGQLTPQIWNPDNNSDVWNNTGNWNEGDATNIYIPVSSSYPVIPQGTGLQNITFAAGAEAGIESGSIAVSGTVSVEYTVEDGRWYPVAYPFDVAHVYSEKLGADLRPYAELTGGHFYLKTYNGTSNLFEYASSIEDGIGYIVQFPDYFNGSKVRFVSGTGVSLSNGNDIEPTTGSYILEGSDNVSSYNIANGSGKTYYRYNQTNTRFEAITESVNLPPFESVVTVAHAQGASLRKVIGDGSQADVITAIDKGLQSLVSDPVVSTEYYDLQGVRVASSNKGLQTLASGVYIVKDIHESGKTSISKSVIR
ncbi:MAG: discoidin domain-containing protein [Candidatus Symbiothrix sp.]|jgi:hypothetical protein|nr:discoidin domain-containing protein [Candidatus Symbiothrix sp.]